MRLVSSLVLAGVLAASSSAALAADDHWSVGAQAGTTGLGANVSWRFSDYFALTAGYSGYTYDDLDRTVDDVDYKGDIDSDIYSIKLDYFPWAGGFFVSGGLVRPDIQLNVTGTPNQLSDLGITGDQARLEGDAEMADGVKPYLGLGWRTSNRAGLGFYAEAGAFLIDPSVNLHARGSAVNNPAAQAALSSYVDEQEDEAKDELDKYHVYPVAVLGVEYTF
ncbi:hypothetical protein [Larsenimonas rhizosphaerae]|uniref:Outer membrane protein beta-barrel domain-containing protein n=1 Tax=Larsenimonas rhizosphaerae TaxID=2944682 RepID=A0AA41ZEZ7_9GAMM|nr:hypothetical protein [Larsenimonas rhizosphaerae]MCM2129364.1 hypothetical protein [Larsenimonas rhizosphaerae]MCX2524019.1 hypothetical protein [Larsenimonas rhizosphaerae]